MNKKGFTLVELSIVLIIIGLVTGGVLAGRSLIEAAQLTRFVNDITKLETNISAFTLRYSFPPGDHPNATNLFPGCAADEANSTCNGNGNRRYDLYGEGTIRIWEHLELSGMGFYGPYTGQYGAGGIQPGINVPRLRWLSGKNNNDAQPISVFAIHDLICYSNSNNGCEPWQPAMIAARNGRNRIVIAPVRIPGPQSYWMNGGIDSAFSQQLDDKIDDGLSGRGQMVSHTRFLGGDVTDCTDGSGNYNGRYILGRNCTFAINFASFLD